MKDVIVIGGGHHNTLGVVRALGQRAIDVELITIGAKKEYYVSSSRYVKNHHAFVDNNDMIFYLIDRSHQMHEEKTVIISCSDSVTEQLNLYYYKLCDHYILPGCRKQGAMAQLMDKTVMIEMAAKHDLLAPETWLIPQDIDKVEYPCVTKAFISSHGSKNDIKIIHSKSELSRFLSNCQDAVFVARPLERQALGERCRRKRCSCSVR